MKNYLVKANRPFQDLAEKKDRILNEKFEVTKERYEELKKKNNLVELIEIKEEKRNILEETEAKPIIKTKEKRKKK